MSGMQEFPATLTRELAVRVIEVSESGCLVETRRRALQAQTTLEVVTAPDVVRFDLAGQPGTPQASGRALWSRQRGMVFSGANLPPLPAGRVYQVWVIPNDAAPISAGLLEADGTGVFMTPPDTVPFLLTMETPIGICCSARHSVLIASVTRIGSYWIG